MLFLSMAGKAKGDEVADLKNQLLELQKRLEQLETKQKEHDQHMAQQNQQIQQQDQQIQQQSQQIQEQDKKIEQQVTKVIEEKKVGGLPESIKWVENMRISGDFRYRYEGIDSQTGGKWNSSINRNRIRARIGIYDKINDDIDVGFRLASGSNDPVSTNQTLEDSFDKKPVWIDLAYADWHPKAMPGLDVIGGKMLNPFYRVGANQLIWDDDLNPEGIAAKYEMPLSESLKAYINAGGFWVGHPDTTTGPDRQTSLWGIQGYLKNTFADKSYLLGGASFYGYGNIQGQQDLQTNWKGSANLFGNTPEDGTTKYKYDFDIAEAFAEYGFNVGQFPVAIVGDYANNTSAPGSKANAWLVGAIFNKAKDPGTWQLGYNYRDIDSDAVVGQFNDSDFDGGGTNAKGHWFNATYQIAKNLQGSVSYFLDEKKNDTNDKYHRLQADLVFKF